MNPEALVRPELDSGVPHGDLLLAFSDLVLGTDRKALDAVRAELAAALGPAAIAGVAAIAGDFTKNDRLANGLGIPLDMPMFNDTIELREQLGINDFSTAINTFRHL